jgi:hypothetical protein
MYIAHPFLAQPGDDARLWRYMTPTIFLSMLLGRSLFFATLESFEDPFEGVPPPAVLLAARSNHHPESKDAQRRLDAWKAMIKRCRASICASCWHAGDEESEAMWKLYGRFEDGLAIVTSLKSIRATFEAHDVAGGLVDYSGRAFEPGVTERDLLQWATTKRPSYKHENEFRLLARRDGAHDGQRDGDAGTGVSVPIHPEVLVEEVVLSPRMQRWQVEMFRGLLGRLGFTRPVHASALLMSPF